MDYFYCYVLGMVITAAYVGIFESSKNIDENFHVVLLLCPLWPLIMPILVPLRIGMAIKKFWSTEQ